MKKTDQISCTRFLEKYGGFSLYDIDLEKTYTIDVKCIWFVKGYGYDLIDNPDHTDGTSTNYEYFLIHYDLFDRVLATEQNNDIALKVTPKDVLLTSINASSTDSRSKLRKRSEIVSPHHQLQSKQEKTVNNYSKKSIDGFRLIVVYS